MKSAHYTCCQQKDGLGIVNSDVCESHITESKETGKSMRLRCGDEFCGL